MNDKYKDIQWVVQKNLTSQSDLLALKNSCFKTGVEFTELTIIPFTSALPEFDRSKKSIIYGSTTFNELACKDGELRKGIFYNEANFSIENYIEKWNRHMLNYDAQITSFKDLIESNQYPADKLLFIRPNDDSKSFSGELKLFVEIKDWYDKLKLVENTNLSPESKIIISEPYNIHYEWRLWIVNKKVVASSKYREYFKLKKEAGCPDEVVAFAKERCKEYTPHDVFVMDVCLCGDEFFIVECGCMNGAGFYNANIDSIVTSVSDYFLKVV